MNSRVNLVWKKREAVHNALQRVLFRLQQWVQKMQVLANETRAFDKLSGYNLLRADFAFTRKWTKTTGSFSHRIIEYLISIYYLISLDNASMGYLQLYNRMGNLECTDGPNCIRLSQRFGSNDISVISVRKLQIFETLPT